MRKALLSEEENLLIINRLHQVLRPFVLRRLKHKVPKYSLFSIFTLSMLCTSDSYDLTLHCEIYFSTMILLEVDTRLRKICTLFNIYIL